MHYLFTLKRSYHANTIVVIVIFFQSIIFLYSFHGQIVISPCDTASNYDILINALQVVHAGASSGINVNNLYRGSVDNESAAGEPNTLHCVLCCSEQAKAKCSWF